MPETRVPFAIDRLDHVLLIVTGMEECLRFCNTSFGQETQRSRLIDETFFGRFCQTIDS